MRISRRLLPPSNRMDIALLFVRLTSVPNGLGHTLVELGADTFESSDLDESRTVKGPRYAYRIFSQTFVIVSRTEIQYLFDHRLQVAAFGKALTDDALKMY
jgi:hypothetical protein